MLKNMRDSRLAEPVFGSSDQHDMYQEMMDQELSLSISRGRGLGLADVLVRQLGGEAPAMSPTPEQFLRTASFVPTEASRRDASKGPWSSPVDFARDIWPHAKRAATRLNVAPEALLAQAALETGWGEHVMSRDDGASSLNLFGIKANGGWSGDSVSRATVEFHEGVASREHAWFRAYADLDAAFDDYAKLIGENPRYAAVRDSGADGHGFARALQDAGYATDPLYAKKISRIIEGDTMRALKAEGALPITNVHTRVVKR
jgi:flagellar protein FlgJ